MLKRLNLKSYWEIKAVKKAKKLYLWDWSELEEEGIRFENLVAYQLLKYCEAGRFYL